MAVMMVVLMAMVARWRKICPVMVLWCPRWHVGVPQWLSRYDGHLVNTAATAWRWSAVAEPLKQSFPRVESIFAPYPHAARAADDKITNNLRHHYRAAKLDSVIRRCGEVLVEVRGQLHCRRSYVQHREDPDAIYRGFKRIWSTASYLATSHEPGHQESGCSYQEGGQGRGDEQQAALSTADVADPRQLVGVDWTADENGDGQDGRRRPGDEMKDPSLPFDRGSGRQPPGNKKPL